MVYKRIFPQHLFEKLKRIKKTSMCFFSSFVFLTNCVTAIWYNNSTYLLLFFCLFITSIIVHTENNIYTNILDKIPITAVILYGAYLFWKKIATKSILKFFIPITFLIVTFLYGYGYLVQSYSFSNDTEIAELYHTLLHLVSSLGHHLILIL